jgi:hypothetical protein
VQYDPRFGDLGAAWAHIVDKRFFSNDEGAAKFQAIQRNFINEAKMHGLTPSNDIQESHIYWDGARIPKQKFRAYVQTAFNELTAIRDTHGDMTMAQAYELMPTKDGCCIWNLAGHPAAVITRMFRLMRV